MLALSQALASSANATTWQTAEPLQKFTSEEVASSKPPNQALCPIPEGVEFDSWDYREAIDRCQYGSD